jgi:Secretion system C-terminal sorting domain/Kelch motif
MKKMKILFSFFTILTFPAFAQHWQVIPLTPLPEKISNNAVCEAFVNDTPFVYSFAGIDSSKRFSGIHLHSYRLNTITKQWQALPPLPDTLGKIACSANRIGSIIYIVGGYHVFANGDEVSSNKVHRFNTITNTFMADAANTLFPVDDQVQCVYKDSLLFVVTGWSNSTNLPNVQVYNPVNNTWSSATALPNNNTYKSFGAAGTIVGDTLYFMGGASSASGFDAQNVLRKGYINPLNPLQITWSFVSPAIKAYRSTAVTLGNKAIWIGGAETSYNYDGIAYNGSGGVAPANKSNIYGAIWQTDTSIRLPMDLRGLAKMSDSSIVLVGGMEQNQQVSNAVLLLQRTPFGTSVKEKIPFKQTVLIYPNPAHNKIKITTSVPIKKIRILNVQFQEVVSSTYSDEIILTDLLPGIYYIELTNDLGTIFKKIIKENQ